MKRKEYDIQPETDLITALIVSDKFIRDIYPILKPKLLKSAYARTVAQWCMEYYTNYQKAPGKVIQDIFNSKSRDGLLRSDEDREMIELFLENISSKFESQEIFNIKFVSDQSEKYLAERSLTALVEDINTNLAAGRIAEAELIVAKHMKTERPNSSSIDVLRNKDAVISALHEDEDFIFKFPGELGEVIGNLNREDFLSFIGPMKRGKTYFLMDFALRCALKQLNVLFVSLEMSQNAVLRRWYQSFLGETKLGEIRDVNIPYFSEDSEKTVSITDVFTKEVKKKGITSHSILRKIKQMQSLTKNGGLRLICYPANSASVGTIKTEINNLAHYHKFYVDVVVIDYADDLAPEIDSPKDFRHKTDHTWKAMRGLSQEIHGLVATATQGTKATFSKDVGQEDISEDIRKIAHVTHMLSLNQDAAEKEKNIMRIGVLANRNEEFFVDQNVMVLYQYAIGKAYIDSKVAKKKNKD